MIKTVPDFFYEQKIWNENQLVIGIDEVGRGCLAGPVYVGAVCYPHPSTSTINWETLSTIGINDSKKLSQKKREELSPFIQNSALAYAIGSSDVSMINSYGIVYAVQHAIYKAVEDISTKLKNKKVHLLLDAFELKKINDLQITGQTAIIKGDSKSISIASASIIAKVARDEMMNEISQQIPEYKWDHNKGYGTQDHRDAIKKYGKHPQHRDLFLRKILSDHTR